MRRYFKFNMYILGYKVRFNKFYRIFIIYFIFFDNYVINFEINNLIYTLGKFYIFGEI